MNLTNNERIALNMIALNLYQPENGARPATFEETSAIWSHMLASTNAQETLSGRTLSATVASLAKKGLVVTQNEPHRRGEPKQDTLMLTRDGFDAWQKAFPEAPRRKSDIQVIVDALGVRIISSAPHRLEGAINAFLTFAEASELADKLNIALDDPKE